MSASLPAGDRYRFSSQANPDFFHLRSKVEWALRVRLAIAGLVWAVVILAHLFGGIFPGVSVLPVALAVVLVSHLAATGLARRRPATAWAALSILDSFLLGALTYYLGGGNSPLLPLFLLQIFATALFANARLAVVVAGLDMLLVTGVSVGEAGGWWRPWPVVAGPTPTPAMLQASVAVRSLLWGLSLVVAAGVTAAMIRVIRVVEREGLARSDRELAALRRINRAVAADRPLLKTLAVILDGAQQTLAVQPAVLVIPETIEGRLRFVFASESEQARFTQVLGVPPDDQALPPLPELRRRLVNLIGDEPLAVMREPRDALAVLGLDGVGGGRRLQSGLIVLTPLRIEGNVFGLMLLVSPRSTLQPAEVEGLSLCATEVTRTLQLAYLRQMRAGLTTALQQRNAQLARILSLNNELRLDLPVDELLQRVVDGIREALDIDKVIISLLDDGEFPRTAAWSGRSRNEPPPMTTSIRPEMLGPDNQISRSYLLRAGTSDSVLRPGNEWGPDDRLIVPIEARGRLIGYLSLGAPASGRVPNRTMIEMIEIMAGQAGLAIQNSTLYRTMVEERTRLNAILSSSAEPIIALDRFRRVQLLNEAAERALGVRADEVLGQPLAESGFPRELRAAIRTAPPPGESGTSEVTLGDGRTFAIAVAPLVGNRNGAVHGWVVTLHDITHLKELDRLKSEFVNTVSHDLRAPLTAVTGYVFLLRNEPLSEAASNALDQIELAIERMSRLISDLLDLGRIESGLGIQRQPLDPAVLLAAVKQELEPLAAAKGLRLVLRLAGELPPIEGDSDRLHQALANLVQNAIKFTPAGEVAIQAEQFGPNLAISVSDTGTGIPAADLPYIFDKFYRVGKRPGSGAQPEGSGLGLSIVKSIVDRHGGRITVESRQGVGTTFRIMLPVATSPVAVGAEE